MIALGPKDRVSIFISRHKAVDSTARQLKSVLEGKKCEFRLTGFDAELPGCFQELNINIDYSWDYLDDEARRHIDDFFFRKLTRSWFLCKAPGERRIDDSKKALLGECSEFDFISSNHSLIKHIAVIANIFAQYRPTKVLIAEDTPYLVNIVRLFDKKYDFSVFKINFQTSSILNRLKKLTAVIKSFVRDLSILLLDFFAIRCLFIFAKYEDKIIIDHRLYKRFAHTGLRDKFLICFFEKGLKARVEALRRGLLYFPLRFSSCYDFILRRKRLRGFSEDLDRVNNGPEGRELFKYGEIVFWEAIKGYISDAFFFAFPRIMENIDIFKRFAQGSRVKLIIMRHDMKTAERNLILAARPLKIPTVVIQHGALGDPNVNSAMCAADITCVWGRASMEWYKGLGFNQDRFAVTGNPGYDELFSRVSVNRQDAVRQKVCLCLNLNPAKKIISFLTSSNHLFSNSFSQGNEMERMTRGILEVINTLRDIQLVIKVHPYDENVNRYDEAIKNYHMSRNAAVVKDFNVFDILEASDLVIAMDSTSGLEALILGKPLIACNLNRGVTLMPYAERAVAIGIKDTNELGQAIRDGLYNKDIVQNLRLNRNEFILDYVYKIDGQSTRRIEELVYNLLDKQAR